MVLAVFHQIHLKRLVAEFAYRMNIVKSFVLVDHVCKQNPTVFDSLSILTFDRHQILVRFIG